MIPSLCQAPHEMHALLESRDRLVGHWALWTFLCLPQRNTETFKNQRITQATAKYVVVVKTLRNTKMHKE